VVRVGNESVCGAGGNDTCLATSVTYVNAFTLVVVIPPHPADYVLSRLDPWEDMPTGSQASHMSGTTGAKRIRVPVTLEVALNGQDFTTNGCVLHLQRAWVVDKIEPVFTPLYGGTLITVTGRYFRNTTEMSCRFGDTLKATDARLLSSTQMVCRTPSVKMHGRVSVELSLDAQHWSARASAQLVNNLVQQTLDLSPGLGTSPSLPMPIDAAELMLGYSGVYLQFYGVRSAYSCGSNAYNNLGHDSITPSPVAPLNAKQAMGKMPPVTLPVTLHLAASSVRIVQEAECHLCATRASEVTDLSGLDVESFALGSTFGLAIASETHGDAWHSAPAPGRLYSWGDNYAGQLGIGSYSARSQPSIVRECCRWIMTGLGAMACTKTLDEETLVYVRAGTLHSMAISDQVGSITLPLFTYTLCVSGCQ